MIRGLSTATKVDRDGSTYHYVQGKGLTAVSGDVHLDNGRIRDFTIVSADPLLRDLVTTGRISDYDRAPNVDPPAADKIVDWPDLEPCDQDGTPPPGHQACGDGQVIEGFTRLTE